MPQNWKNTVDYCQPDFYHFGQESILLARSAQQLIGHYSVKRKLRCLDLCAGCGVVGLEIMLYRFPYTKQFQEVYMDFCEIQQDFLPYYQKNIKLFLSKEEIKRTRYFNHSFVNLKEDRFKNKYDLIVCNPPFFNIANYRLSPIPKKDICRAFTTGSELELLLIIKYCLNNTGSCLFLARKEKSDSIIKMVKTIRDDSHRLVITEQRAEQHDKIVLFCLLPVSLPANVFSAP